MAEEFEGGLVTVLDDEGKEHQFEVLDAIETDEARYVALLPVYENPAEGIDDDGELIILEVQNEDGNDVLCPIEDEELFNEIGAIFEERLAELFEIEEVEELGEDA